MNLAYDLFLLTFNLSQLHNREKIIQLFLEGLHEIFKPSIFTFNENPISDNGDVFEIKSRQNNYGYISFQSQTILIKEHKILICNAIQMVAVIIDNLDYSVKLEVEKERLHNYAELKLLELKNTVKELEDAKTASLNLIEDLTEEIEKRKSVEAYLSQSERDLQETQLILKSTLESPVDMIILAVDMGYKYLSFNNAHKAVMKAAYGSDVELGMNLFECMVGDEDIKAAKENYSRAMKGESFITVQEYGEIDRSYYETFYNPIRNENNEIVGATAFARNITERKKAELALKESEEKFRNLFEHSPVGKSITGIDGSINVNKAFCDLLGYTSYELKSRNWKEISHPGDIPMTEKLVKELINGKRDFARFEKRYFHKNGSTVYTDVATYLQHDNNDKPEYFITTVNDITTRKKIEAESFRLQDVINSSLNEIYIFNSTTLKFEYLNSGAIKNIGYTVEEMKEMTPTDIKPEYTKEEFRNTLKPLLSGKKEILVFETIHKRKNGTHYPVEIHLQYYNKDGAGLFMAVINDITKRKISELDLKESEEKYRTLIEVSIDTIFINQNNRITYINKSGLNLLGAETRDQIVGKSPLDIFHPDYHETIKKRISEMLGNQTTASLMEEKIVRLDGVIVDVEVAATPFFFRNEQAIQVILRDITDRKKAEAEIKLLNEGLEKRVVLRTAQLESANKELEAFSYSVSHDLRAPLRAIHSFTGILREDYKDNLDAEGRRICGIIESSAIHMGNLIDDLLSFSRVGRTELKLSKINMTKLAQSVYLDSGDEKDRISIDIRKLPSAYGDFSAIRQVVVNLIMNAIKYSSKTEKPSILIGYERIDDEVVYFVKDNGVGFDMMYVDKLFGVFQRLHSTKEFEGNGVGLAIVQRIIHRHCGKVWAEGEVGKGATFFFTLPCQDKR